MAVTASTTVSGRSPRRPRRSGSNSQRRSSRSSLRARRTTSCGSPAAFWISERVWSTESCTWAAMSARSWARTRSRRSVDRSRSVRTHHGANRTRNPPTKSTVPTRTPDAAPEKLPVRESSPSPRTTRTAPATVRSATRRHRGDDRDTPGAVLRRSRSLVVSAVDAPRQTTSAPTAPTSSVSVGTPTSVTPSERVTRRTANSATERARTICSSRRSATTREAIDPSSSAAGTNTHIPM